VDRERSRLSVAPPHLGWCPRRPARSAWALAVGAWVNANALGVLAFRPDLKDHPVYRESVAGSFVAASWGFTGLAAVAWKR
jgi:hypothetical protein